MAHAEEAHAALQRGAAQLIDAAGKIDAAVSQIEQQVGLFNSAHSEDVQGAYQALMQCGEAACAEFGPTVQQLAQEISHLQEVVQTMRTPADQIRGQLSLTADQMVEYSARYTA